MEEKAEQNGKFGAFLDSLNIIKSCRSFHVPLWQCPHFLFPLMGLITIVSMLGTYFAASAKYVEDPQLVALIVIAVTTVIFVIGHFIIMGFSHIAEANRLKSEFVSIVSHQLRTPLTGLRWSINALDSGRYGALNDKQKEFFDIVHESTDRMLKLVNNLLDVSRVEAGKVKFEMIPLSLVKETEAVIEDVLPLARASGVDLKLKTEPDIPTVIADPVKIRIIIQNLTDNAVKYIKGGGTVSINIYKDGGSVVLKVSDTGVGIPQDEQKQIFQKFFRSQSILKHKTEGTGLGLFISKSYVDAMGGQMGFDSKIDVGTTFWFSLPICKEAERKCEPVVALKEQKIN
jgi:signal transduction histidine kinase